MTNISSVKQLLLTNCQKETARKSNPYNGPVFSISTRKILPNCKPHSPISDLLPEFRSSLHARVLTKLEPNRNSSDNCSSSMATPKKKEGSKSFSMRYGVEEVPMATVLGTDDSLRSKLQRNSPEDESFNKDTGAHKYLKMIKPLYVKASKIRFFDQLSPRKQGSRASVFRQVCRNLVKSRSAVGIVPVPAPARRRDDSALQQRDGIQSAILHCKRSYSSSSSSSTISQECSMLSRSASDSSYQKALNPPRNSTEEEEK